MAIAAAVPNSFKTEALQGIHLAADIYKIALFTSAANLGAATTAYSATGEVSGPGYTAGGVTLTGRADSVDTNVGIISFANPAWANASITARGALIYNSSKANRAVAVLDFGADITSSGGAFNVSFPAATAAAGLVRYGP